MAFDDGIRAVLNQFQNLSVTVSPGEFLYLIVVILLDS